MDLLLASTGFLAGATFLFGLLVGSFLNVIIYRVPKILDRDWKIQCHEYLELEADKSLIDEKFSIAWPGSACPNCGSKIRPWHNIPLLGYAMLRGKCADCDAPIGIRYPIVELVTGLLSLVVFLQFGATLQTVFALGFTWTLVALAGIDFDTKLLPDNITLPLLWAGLLINFLFDPEASFTSFDSAFIGAIAGYLALWSVFWIFKLVTGKEGMGYGDFKLLSALGAWIGWAALPMIILLSSIIGLIAAVLMMILISHDRRVPIAFGPYLAIAGWVAMLFGEEIGKFAPFLSII